VQTWSRPASCSSGGLTSEIGFNPTSSLVVRNGAYNSWYGSSLVIQSGECFPPGYTWFPASVTPKFYFTSGSCPAGYTDNGGNIYTRSGTPEYESFCCPRSFTSSGNGCWSPLVDTTTPITAVIYQTLTSVVSGKTRFGLSAQVVSTTKQSTIYDNRGGYGPYTVGVPVFEDAIRVRVPLSASTTIAAATPTSKPRGKHIGVLALAAFIPIVVVGGLLFCCCLVCCCSGSEPRHPTYYESTPSYVRRQYPTYEEPTPRPRSPVYPSPAVLSKKKQDEEPEPPNYPPVRIR